MDLREQLRQAIAASINDCIRNDTSFGSYADAATEAVMEVLAKQEPVAWRTFDGEGGYDYRSFADNEDYQVSWEARNPNHKGWVEPLYLTSGAQAQPAPNVPNDVIEQAVNRFLSWKLPKDFRPNGGMVFIPMKGHGYDSPYWPIGTNLFTAEQAREMLRYALAASALEAKL